MKVKRRYSGDIGQLLQCLRCFDLLVQISNDPIDSLEVAFSGFCFHRYSAAGFLASQDTSKCVGNSRFRPCYRPANVAFLISPGGHMGCVGRAAPGSEIYAYCDLKPLDVVAQEAVGIIIVGIQWHAITQANQTQREQNLRGNTD